MNVKSKICEIDGPNEEAAKGVSRELEKVTGAVRFGVGSGGGDVDEPGSPTGVGASVACMVPVTVEWPITLHSMLSHSTTG
ncbi:Prolyl Hydroxylase Egln3 [Manis pentadactyla]|nr:Prolyl Hydroxylase Egln3 [Manis pentadactyla]